MSDTKYPYSLFIAGLNELHHLEEVLPFFLDLIEDVHYFDLGSNDGSVDYAKGLKNCQLHQVEREPTIEILHFKYAHLCKYDWVIYADPDERWSPVLLNAIALNIKNDTASQLGIMANGIKFYLNQYPLKGTRWGGIKTRGVAFHRQRVLLSPHVHRSKKIKEGFKQIHLNAPLIVHYWMKDFKELIEKHRRYLKQEARSRYDNHTRVSLVYVIYSPFQSFLHCYFTKKGYLDGFTGLMLSFFWAWYNGLSNYRLYRYQLTLKRS